MRISASAALAAVFYLCVLSSAKADDKPDLSGMQLPAHVETHRTVQLAGKPLDYDAVAETIGLTDLKGEPTASIFTISYLAKPSDGAPRPVAFVFNGGPGAASVYLQLGAIGPVVLDMPGDGRAPDPPVRLVDNPDSWLAFTDLVFVDPVGTGFSRATGKDGNADKAFWNVRSDLSSLAAVVRRWLIRHQRWGSPVYLVGESYGGLRAAALPDTLARDVGVTVNGMVMLSPALDTEILHPHTTDLLAPAFELPSFAASASVLSGQPAGKFDTAPIEQFALSDYLLGLAAMRGVPGGNDPFIARIAGLTGLSEDVVRRERGRVTGGVFAHEQQRAQGRILSLYDATVGRASDANPWNDRAGDPVLDPVTAAFTSGFEQYAEGTLGYKTEQPYYTLSHQVAQQWDWDAAGDHQNGLGLALSSLQNTLLAHPGTKVLIANGRYDLVTPYLASRWLVDQLAIPAATRDQIRLRVYEGGHMMYMRPPSRAALSADAAALFASDAPPAH